VNRVERFRQYRHSKRKIIFIFLLFILLISTGLLVADYSVNSIMLNERKIEIISLVKLDDSYMELSLMKNKLYINTRYISRDCERLKDTLKNLIHLWP